MFHLQRPYYTPQQHPHPNESDKPLNSSYTQDDDDMSQTHHIHSVLQNFTLLHPFCKHYSLTLAVTTVTILTFTLTLLSGLSCSFLHVPADAYDEITQLNHYLSYVKAREKDEVLDLGLFCEGDLSYMIDTSSSSEDVMRIVSKSFLSASLAVNGLQMLLGLSIATFLPLSNKVWNGISVLSIICILCSLPVFFILDSPPCDEYTCKLGPGSVLLICSLMCHAIGVAVTQFVDVPDWKSEWELYQLMKNQRNGEKDKGKGKRRSFTAHGSDDFDNFDHFDNENHGDGGFDYEAGGFVMKESEDDLQRIEAWNNMHYNMEQDSPKYDAQYHPNRNILHRKLDALKMVITVPHIPHHVLQTPMRKERKSSTPKAEGCYVDIEQDYNHPIMRSPNGIPESSPVSSISNRSSDGLGGGLLGLGSLEEGRVLVALGEGRDGLNGRSGQDETPDISPITPVTPSTPSETFPTETMSSLLGSGGEGKSVAHEHEEHFNNNDARVEEELSERVQIPHLSQHASSEEMMIALEKQSTHSVADDALMTHPEHLLTSATPPKIVREANSATLISPLDPFDPLLDTPHDKHRDDLDNQDGSQQKSLMSGLKLPLIPLSKSSSFNSIKSFASFASFHSTKSEGKSKNAAAIVSPDNNGNGSGSVGSKSFGFRQRQSKDSKNETYENEINDAVGDVPNTEIDLENTDIDQNSDEGSDPDLEHYPSEASLSTLSLPMNDSNSDFYDSDDQHRPSLRPERRNSISSIDSAASHNSNDASSASNNAKEMSAIIAGVLNKRLTGKITPISKRRRRRRKNRSSSSSHGGGGGGSVMSCGSYSSYSSHGSLLDEVIDEEGENNLSNETDPDSGAAAGGVGVSAGVKGLGSKNGFGAAGDNNGGKTNVPVLIETSPYGTERKKRSSHRLNNANVEVFDGDQSGYESGYASHVSRSSRDSRRSLPSTTTSNSNPYSGLSPSKDHSDFHDYQDYHANHPAAISVMHNIKPNPILQSPTQMENNGDASFESEGTNESFSSRAARARRNRISAKKTMIDNSNNHGGSEFDQISCALITPDSNSQGGTTTHSFMSFDPNSVSKSYHEDLSKSATQSCTLNSDGIDTTFNDHSFHSFISSKEVDDNDVGNLTVRSNMSWQARKYRMSRLRAQRTQAAQESQGLVTADNSSSKDGVKDESVECNSDEYSI